MTLKIDSREKNQASFFGHNVTLEGNIFVASLSINTKCNLECKHCYSYQYKNHDISINLERWKKVINDLASFKCNVLSFTGGEPFLYFKEIKELARHSLDRGLQLGLVSNGTIIDSGIASELAELNFTVTISLDGQENFHDKLRGEGTFKKATHSIGLLVKHRIRTFVLTTVMRSNLHDLESLFKICEDIGAESCILSTIKPTGKGKHIFKEEYLRQNELIWLYEIMMKLLNDKGRNKIPTWFLCQGNFFAFLIQKNRKDLYHLSQKLPPAKCRAFREKVWISSSGEVMGCPFIPISIGNVFKSSLEYLLSKDKIRVSMQSGNLSKKCSECIYNVFCGGGCRALAYANTGDVFGYDPSCVIKF